LREGRCVRLIPGCAAIESHERAARPPKNRISGGSGPVADHLPRLREVEGKSVKPVSDTRAECKSEDVALKNRRWRE